MSNDLMTTFANTLPEAVRAQLADDIAKDISRLGNIGGKDAITVGQDKTFMFPDGTKAAGPLDLVVVDFVYRNEYYANAYDRDNPEPPVCFAVNDTYGALTPTDNSPLKQADKCSECKYNEFGSALNAKGKPMAGKACKNTVYMAVLPPDATSDSPLLVLKTSPTAITPFNQHVAKVGRTVNLPLWAITTKVFFDDNVTYASLRFDISGPNPIAEETYKRRAEARQRLLQEPDFTANNKE